MDDAPPTGPSPPTGETPELDGRRHVLGTAHVRRIGRLAFPVHELNQNGEALALMGRTGWFKIYFGSGQRIELAAGDRWNIRSVRAGSTVCPVIREEGGGKVAVAGVRHGTYGINTADDAFVFYASDPRRLGRARWLLRHHEDELAVVTRRPLAIETFRPVPLGVVFLCFVLARYGIFGERTPTLPTLRWG
jgi:hypothetical protein